MKQNFLIFMILVAKMSVAQLCDFDTPDWPYMVMSDGSATFSITSGSPDEPNDAVYGVDGSRALIASGGKVEVLFSAVNTLLYPMSYLRYRLGAGATAGSGKGMDLGTDYVQCHYRTDTALPWVLLSEIKGYGNALWSIDDHALVVRSDADNPLSYNPSDGGTQSGAAPNTVLVDALPRAADLEIRITLYSDRSNEVWSLDQVELVKPDYWTNASGDGDLLNPSNWMSGTLPDSSGAFLMTDTGTALPDGATLRCRRFITYAADTLNLTSSGIRTGEWLHCDGTVLMDSGIVLSTVIGTGELQWDNGIISGRMSMELSYPFRSGWVNLSSPLQTRWSDIFEHMSLVNYGAHATPSVYAWDATNANWYGLSDGSEQTSGQPVNVYAGPGFMDSSDVIRITGRLAHAGDTSVLFYGIPDVNSPFPSAAGNDGWNLVGNPFPFPVDLNAVFSDIDFPAECSPTAYIYDADRDLYRSYNSGTGGFNGGTPFIAPWQAFWVQLNTPLSSLVDIVHKPSHRGMTGGGYFYKTNPGRVERFTVTQGKETREVRVVDYPGMTMSWEHLLDHYQRSARGFEVYLDILNPAHEHVRVALKTLDPSHKGGIPLVIESDESGKTTIQTDGVGWWLEDRDTGNWTDLGNSNHHYIGAPGTKVFYLWRKPSGISIEEEEGSSCEAPLLTDGWWMPRDHRRWKLFDLTGRKLMDVNGEPVPAVSLPHGVYLWKSPTCSQKVLM